MLHLKGYTDIELIYQDLAGEASIVYRAVRESDGRRVALKMPAKTSPEARSFSSLSREFSLLRNHDLKNVPGALDLINTGPSMVLVLEYIEAPALRDILSPEPMPLSVFFSFAAKLVEIVGDIHIQSLIHCDLTPGNILFRQETGTVHLIDFGCALDFPSHTRAIINPALVEGSPSFMSPEQTGRLNRGLDYRTDFYSLGVIFYRLLTGQLPFAASDQSELVHCHIAVPPTPPEELVEGVPQALSELVLKLLQKDAANRYQSAEGIYNDLVTLSRMGLEETPDASMELATFDISDRLIIPEKLYGREKECDKLLSLYNATADGHGQMVFVTGHAGIGKTSLVKELYAPLAGKGGYLATGKFDQYQHNRPYSALMEAFDNLLHQILTESVESVECWRHAILDALGPNGRLLTDVIPGLELLIGPQPHVDELPVVEARDRFSNVFIRFIEMLGESERPIVIFLDDLQWIDAPSLTLLEKMAGSIVATKMMLIGAYRNNEVPETHRLALSLVDMRRVNEKLYELALGELSKASLIELLSDTLHQEPEQLTGLNDLLLKKTHGNPLFYKTMLDGFYTDGHIRFDYQHRKWIWDLQAMESTPYADNVVDMLQNRIPHFTGGQADMLGLAACLGNVFELSHLAKLADLPRYKVAQDLMAAVSSGLLQPIGSEFELLAEDLVEALPSISFRFAHDRIQQAAYLLIEDERKPELHLNFGRMLLAELKEGDAGQKFFAALANLNQGRELMASEERSELAHLNLKAGKKAKESAAFNDSHLCLSIARELLGEESWRKDHHFSLEVHLEFAEACYLVGDFEQAENLYGLIREKSRNTDDLLTLINIQAKQYHHQGRYSEAIDLEVEGLAMLGIDLPTSDEELNGLFLEEGQKIDTLLADREIEYLIEHQEVDDVLLTRTHEILFDLFADGYLMGRGPLLACAAAISTRLSVEHGTCAMSSIGYINYGTCLCAGGQYAVGHGFGRVAVKLADRYQVAALKNYTYHLFALSINHWLKPLGSSYDYWREASKLALDSGSPYAGWVFLQLAHVLLASGVPLERVEAQIEKSRHYLINAGMKDIAFMLELIVAQPVRHLRGKTKDITTLDDKEFNCEQLLEEYKEALFFLSHIHYPLLRATLIGRDIQSLATMSEWMVIFDQTMQGQFIHVDCYFYFTLHLTAGYGNLAAEDRQAYLEAIDENLERFSSWAELCPHNYQHKYLLIAAERTRLEGKTVEAMDLYDQAIDAAYASAFLQDAALANELAGLFWLSNGRNRHAIMYLEQAMAAYSRWGASGKVSQLKEDHPGLAVGRESEIKDEKKVNITGTQDFSAQLDLNSILKVSQAVSRHMVLDKLAGELVDLAMQNAGATKAVLLLRQKDGFATVRCARVVQAGQQQVIQQGEPGQCEVPDLVVNYVLHSGESLVIDNALEDNRFGRSKYIIHHGLKSICCVPIVKQNEVSGLLYLENSQTGGAFRQDRLQVLMAIASQAAISLDNAVIYQELDAMNKNLESMVMDRTRELNQKNRELEILSITDQLTGLFNRHHIEETIKDEISRCLRYRLPLSLVLFDIDNFKDINDTYGHDVGDEVLKAIASVLQENTRGTDLAGRWGGEEFLVLLPQADEKVSMNVAEKLRLAIETLQHSEISQVTASFGVTQFMEGDDVNNLVKRADQALYKAKERGRNQVVTNWAA